METFLHRSVNFPGMDSLIVLLILTSWLGTSSVGSLEPPRNLTVERVGDHEAVLSWEADVDTEVLFYELTYELGDYQTEFYRVVRGVSSDNREVLITCLKPTREYTAFMVTVDTGEVRSNQSGEVTFTTSDGIETLGPSYYTPKAGEILVVVVVIIAWVVVVMVFLKRWASIRILQPMEPRYRHSPKNLENVKIVKRAQDSVIYKNYGRKLSVTIVAREKRRLQRMHTIAALPTIEMERHVAEM